MTSIEPRSTRRRAAVGILVGGLLILAVGVALRLGLLDSVLAGSAPLRVIAIGHAWWWEFDYPGAGIKTANELHLPENTQIALEVSSADVVHTLSIPELSLLANSLPGTTTSLGFRSPGTGEYGGECSEICGLAHNMMRVKVVVQRADEFEAWLAAQKLPAAVPESEQQWRGYEMLTTACAKCHSLNPNEQRTDLVGPNLAHLMSRSVFVGATFDLTESNLRRWIRDTQAMKAGNDMKVNLPRDDFAAVIDYLRMLK